MASNHSVSKSSKGIVTVTVRPLSSDGKGETTTPEVSKSFTIEKVGSAGKSFKEKTGKKTDGQNSKDKTESAKLLDHVVESASSKKMKVDAAPGDFQPDDAAPKEKPDSMTDMTQGRSFKIKSSSDKKKSKED